MNDAVSRTETRPWRRILPVVATVVVLLAALPLAVMLDLRDLTMQLSRRQAIVARTSVGATRLSNLLTERDDGLTLSLDVPEAVIPGCSRRGT